MGTNGVGEAVLAADPAEEVQGGERVRVEVEEGSEVGCGERGDEGVNGGVFSPLGARENGEDLRREIGLQ